MKTFVVQAFRIPSGSMERTLQIGDRVLVDKLSYRLHGVGRGDVVVFSGQGSWDPVAPPAPGNPVTHFYHGVMQTLGLETQGTDYIKRVIGLPGDHVACCTNGKVTVNGVPLSEGSFIYPGNVPSIQPFRATVPLGRLWMMGDHRGDSADSRYHVADPGGGTIPESEVVGRAFVIIWPPSRLTQLRIPPTFKQAALDASGRAAPAVPAITGIASALPLLTVVRRVGRRAISRRRRRQSRSAGS
jgi:signal peptidase I